MLSKIEAFSFDLENIGKTPLMDIKWPFINVGFYFLSIVILQHLMSKTSKPFKLLNIVRIHNVILFLWSMFMFFGCLYHLLPFLINYGIYYTVIHDPKLLVFDKIQIWYYLYYLCKYYEMIDTVILILKKKNIIFLHIFHHSIMVFCTYSAIIEHWTPSWYALIFNNFIHILMYYYYFISTFGYKIWWKKYLTILQIIQFIGGVYTAFIYIYDCFDYDNKSFLEYDYIYGPSKCTMNSNPWVAMFNIIIIISFVVLFSIFYYNSYSKKKKKAQ